MNVEVRLTNLTERNQVKYREHYGEPPVSTKNVWRNKKSKTSRLSLRVSEFSTTARRDKGSDVALIPKSMVRKVKESTIQFTEQILVPPIE